MEENNVHGGINNEEEAGTGLNFPVKLIITTGVVLLILFGLYWGGRHFFYEPAQIDRQTIGELPLAVAECEEIYTDLLQALIDFGQHGKPVCGFDISGNRYMDLTLAISLMDKLVIIRANDNAIEEIPDWIGQLKRLRFVELRNNRIGAVPEAIGELKALEILDLRGNPIPAEEVAKAKRLLPQAQVLF